VAEDEQVVWFLSEEEEEATRIGLALQFGKRLLNHSIYERQECVHLEMQLCAVEPGAVGAKPQTEEERLAYRYILAGLVWQYVDHEFDIASQTYRAVFKVHSRLKDGKDHE